MFITVKKKPKSVAVGPERLTAYPSSGTFGWLDRRILAELELALKNVSLKQKLLNALQELNGTQTSKNTDLPVKAEETIITKAAGEVS